MTSRWMHSIFSMIYIYIYMHVLQSNSTYYKGTLKYIVPVGYNWFHGDKLQSTSITCPIFGRCCICTDLLLLFSSSTLLVGLISSLLSRFVFRPPRYRTGWGAIVSSIPWSSLHARTQINQIHLTNYIWYFFKTGIINEMIE